MELSGKCASESIRYTMTSFLMMANHFFICFIILVSFFMTIFAIQKLWKQNIFPNCTRILLWSAIINGVIHQFTVAEIRIRTVFRALAYGSEPCLIQFQSSECLIENNLYYFTNFFSSFCCISLFFDRLFSINTTVFYNSKSILAFFLIFQSVSPAIIIYWVSYNTIYTGYVPMCNYPPSSSAGKFHTINQYRLYVLGTVFIFSFVILFFNRKQEKKIIHKVYDTESRYKCYENLLATKAVCILIAAQTACLVITATATSIFNDYKDYIPPTILHPLIALMMGLTYSNFFLPIIICYQTNQITIQRYKTIGKMCNQKVHFSDHFASLDLLWQRTKRVEY